MKKYSEADCLANIDTLIKKLGQRVGYCRILALLRNYDERTEGYTQKQLKEIVDKLGVWSEDEIDGG